jgi:hypothetical protein
MPFVRCLKRPDCPALLLATRDLDPAPLDAPKNFVSRLHCAELQRRAERLKRMQDAIQAVRTQTVGVVVQENALQKNALQKNVEKTHDLYVHALDAQEKLLFSAWLNGARRTLRPDKSRKRRKRRK